jgi:UDP-N-acetylmuramoyl-tripeptide--D-alanyl-D-alanine ligase
LVGIDANGPAGIIRNMLKLKRGDRFFVQEVGIVRKGRMKGNASLLRPELVVVTTIGQDHYKSFRTLEATAEEKGVLVEALPETGVAVLNADDPYVLAMAERTEARVLTYGTREGVDVRATDIQADWPDRLSLTVTYQGERMRIQTGLFGDLLATAVLAAIASALAAGFNLQQCARSLNGIEAFDRRMSIHQSPQGIWFVNDTFKAPFWSVSRVLEQMADARAPRKTVVFGSFSDTSGSDSPKYRSAARQALEVADRVIFVGKKAAYIPKIFNSETTGRLFAVEAPDEACRMLSESALRDELILIKSNSREHLERLIYGQDVELKCWKKNCPKLMSCHQCAESGLPVRGRFDRA